MIEAQHVINMFEKRTSTINKVIAIVMPIAVIIGGVGWYMQNVWKPTVEVNNVDYDAGTATVTVNGIVRPLYAGSTLSARFGWGVRFAGKQFDTWDRIELVKNDMTRKTLLTK